MKKVIILSAGLALAIFLVGMFFGGGGHGWGSHLVWNTFWPISLFMANLDESLRCIYTQPCVQGIGPGLQYEISILILYALVIMAWFAFLGSLLYTGYRKIKA